MMRRLRDLFRAQRGTSILEFALIAPAFCTFIVAIGNLGILFFAHSGLKSAVAEGARYASTYPKPSTDLIKARLAERRFGLNDADITGPEVTSGTHDGRPYLDIQMTYKAKLNFIFFEWSSYTFTENRRVFVYS